MSAKTYLVILRTGVYLSLFCVFLVFKNLLFPYITSKQIPFNLLVEFLFIMWVAFVIKYPEYRPRKNLMSAGLLAFFALLVISCFTGVDFNLSFWGDVERMLGVFHLLHFLALYFIIITVMRRWQDWKIFFIISIINASLVSLKGLAPNAKAFSTIGNTAYVSAYLIFNMYFSVLLAIKEKNKILKPIYLIGLPIMLLEFDRADTTGAIVGLGFSLLVLMFVYGLLALEDKRKKLALVLASLFLFSASFYILFINRDNFILNSDFYLVRKLRSINIQKNTFQTRLISWRAALKEIKNHPWLGTGHGNYAIIFDKYFDPKFFNYTTAETYFDRAHNNVLDIASTAGIPALLAYLFALAAAFYYVLKCFRGVQRKSWWRRWSNKLWGASSQETAIEEINKHEFIIIFALLVAYFVQNLAVFDSWVTYVSLMMVLGYIYWLYQGNNEADLKSGEEEAEWNPREILFYVVVGSLVLLIAWNYNILPWRMLIRTIDGQIAFSMQPQFTKEVLESDARAQESPLYRVAKKYDLYGMFGLDAAVKVYKVALADNTVLDRDSRSSLIRLFISNPNALYKINYKDKTQEENFLKKLELVDFAIEQAEANVKLAPHDSLAQMMLAQILNLKASLFPRNSDDFKRYSDRAIEAIDKSIAASPGRVPVYYQKAQILMTREEMDKALETLEYAYQLNPDYGVSACNIAKFYFSQKDTENGIKYIDICLSKKAGVGELRRPDFVKQLIDYYLANNLDKQHTIKLMRQYLKLRPKDAKMWINLALMYKETGQTTKAIEAAQKVESISSEYKTAAQKFIQELEQQLEQ